MDERRVATKERRVAAKAVSPDARHATGPRRVMGMASFPPAVPAGTPPRVLRPGEHGYVMGKTTYATEPAASPPGTPYPAPAMPPPAAAVPLAPPANAVTPQRTRADGTVPVKGDKDWVRYAGPDAS